MTTFAKGDRVKVTYSGTFEGVVDGDGDIEFPNSDSPNGTYLMSGQFNNPGISVEKVVPPVPVIQPGDFVKSKPTGREYLVTRYQGCVRLTDGANITHLSADRLNDHNRDEPGRWVVIPR